MRQQLVGQGTPATREAAEQELDRVIVQMQELLPRIKMPRVVHGGSGEAFNDACQAAEKEHARDCALFKQLERRRNELRILLGLGTWEPGSAEPEWLDARPRSRVHGSASGGLI